MGGRCRGLAYYRDRGAAKHLWGHGIAAGQPEREHIQELLEHKSNNMMEIDTLV